MAMTCDATKATPKLTFPGGNGEDLSASDVVLQKETPSYAVPGNTYPGKVQLLTFTLKVAEGAKLGLRSVQLTPDRNPPILSPLF